MALRGTIGDGIVPLLPCKDQIDHYEVFTSEYVDEGPFDPVPDRTVSTGHNIHSHLIWHVRVEPDADEMLGTKAPTREIVKFRFPHGLGRTINFFH